MMIGALRSEDEAPPAPPAAHVLLVPTSSSTTTIWPVTALTLSSPAARVVGANPGGPFDVFAKTCVICDFARHAIDAFEGLPPCPRDCRARSAEFSATRAQRALGEPSARALRAGRAALTLAGGWVLGGARNAISRRKMGGFARGRVRQIWLIAARPMRHLPRAHCEALTVKIAIR